MKDNRLSAFESMLKDIQSDYELKASEVSRLKAQGKE